MSKGPRAGTGDGRATGHGSPLRRLGTRVVRYRRLVLLIWLLLLAVAGGLYPVLESRLGSPDYTVSGSESVRAQSLLAQHFPRLGTEQDVVVFRSREYQVDDPRYRRAVAGVLGAIRGRPNVVAVISPYDSPAGQVATDRHVCLAMVGLTGGDTVRSGTATDLQRRIRDAAGGQVEAYLTGPSPFNVDLSALEFHDQNVAETIGVPIALAVLLLSLGALVAAVLPVAIALASVLLSMGVLTLVAAPLHLDRFVTVVTTVIGIGIGIDYSLFIVSRFREELAKRARPGSRMRPGSRVRPGSGAVGEAIGIALATSGRTVVTSGVIVIVALASMVLINGHVFMEIAVASALVVAGCLAASLTLLPALLALLGHRVNRGWITPKGWAAGQRRADGRPGRWARWGGVVLRRPVLLGVPALLLLAALSLPVFSIRLGLDLALPALDRTPSGQGQRIVAAAFGPGAAGPVQVVACETGGPLRPAQLDAMTRLAGRLRADRRVAGVATGTDDRGGCGYLQVTLAQPIDSTASGDLVADLRHTMAPEALAGTGIRAEVGGFTAQNVDLAAETVGKLPWVIGLVLALSFCYLLAAFRSAFVPAKAVVLTILATAASLGLTVLVFQEGHGERLLGFTSVGTLQAYLPVALFALLFGLSMDYEVFLVGRIREEWLRNGHDNARAVTTGLDHTARQITAGAAIMVAVFGSLLVAQVLELKQFGFGLAVAVLLDATIVRMLLVPAAMGLASGANWWLPRWLAGRREAGQPGEPRG